MKKDLLEKIEKQGGFKPPYSMDILVSIEDFFVRQQCSRIICC
ncbi:hypothetical protein CLCAR_1415 [Clostridium carboxidivorans P7]|nr:hypothetical protein [Clostridium carboxidivorans]EFG88670.1 hypothetical protein CLCAR_1415 [Clostridium carboxidivorans P7]